MRGERLNNGLSVVIAGDGPPLVFLPGLGSGADLSVAVPKEMERSARSVAMGSNRTVHMINRPLVVPTGTTIAELAGWYAIALHERFGRPVDVLGISGGGVTSLQMAMDHPEVVHRLVIGVAASRASDRGRRDLLRGVELEREGRSAAWVSSGLVAHGPLRLLLAGMYRMGRGAPRAQGETAVIEALQTWDVTDRLGEISAPTLLVGGSRDPVIPPELVEATANGIPNARMVMLAGRGHMTALIDPRSMRAISAFLDEP